MGGGFLYVPTLTLIFGFDQKMAVGTSLAVMIFASCAATIVYSKQRRPFYTVAAILAVPGIIFSALGSFITQYADARILVILFALVLVLMSLQMLIPSLQLVPVIRGGPNLHLSLSRPDDTGSSVRISCLHLIVWGAMGGLVSGITGTSGGAFFVPALVAVGIPIHIAVATSLLTIIPTSIAGASTHALLGQVSLSYLAVYGTGAAIGASAGAMLAPRIQAPHIQKGFGILLIGIALLMIQQKVLAV